MSGCRHATWLMGSCAVFEGETPRLGPHGVPERRWMLFPAGQSQIIDTWHVAGLRGTGSDDVAIEDVFIPHERTVAMSHFEPPRHPGALYAFASDRASGATATIPVYNPGTWLVAIGFAAVSLGVARGALDAFAELASTKSPRGGKALLREDPVVQTHYARAEAALGAARAWLYKTVRAGWETVCARGSLDARQRVLLRLASVHAAERAAEVVEAVWKAAGASSIFVSSPLERRFRDVHVATQNIAVSPVLYGAAGRMLLSSDEGMPGS
jgi:alkylation response protein AidB-like acyl-CoA dehydrogenase